MKIPCPECGREMNSNSAMCRKCRYPDAASDDRSIDGMGSAERAVFGCVCSFENADGKRLVLHPRGAPAEGLREACEAALALDESFRLICYSTPSTIYQDMKGYRMGSSQKSDQVGGSDRPPFPEAIMLARIGLRHMLHPVLATGKRT